MSNAIRTTLAIPLPVPEVVPPEFADLGACFESGWIATVPDSRIVDVGSEPHSADDADAWGRQLLAAWSVATESTSAPKPSSCSAAPLDVLEVALPVAERSDHADIGLMWESGWIATVPGSGVVYVESEPHAADVIARWALALLSASRIARGEIKHAA